MTVAKIRELMGDAQKDYTDEQIVNMITMISSIAHIVIDNGLTPKEG